MQDSSSFERVQEEFDKLERFLPGNYSVFLVLNKIDLLPKFQNQKYPLSGPELERMMEDVDFYEDFVEFA